MTQNNLIAELETIIQEFEKENILDVNSIKSDKFLKIVNKYNHLIMLGDIEIYRPICLNNYAINFFGYENNWLKDEDYFNYITALHPDTYQSFLEILQFYKKDNKDYLFINYKLLYQGNEWKLVTGITKVLLRKDNQPKFSITVGVLDESLNHDSLNKLKVLTKREQEISNLVSTGLNNNQIADKLNISPSTVHSHKKNIYKKLNISKVSELVSLNEKYAT